MHVSCVSCIGRQILYPLRHLGSQGSCMSRPVRLRVNSGDMSLQENWKQEHTSGSPVCFAGPAGSLRGPVGKASAVLRSHSVLARGSRGSRPSRSAPHTWSRPSHWVLPLTLRAPHTRVPPFTVHAPHTGPRPSRSAPLTPGPYPSGSTLTPGSGTSGAALQPETWKRTIQGCKPCPSSCANSAAQWVDFMNQTPSSRSISCKGRDSCYFCAKLIEFRSKNSLRDLLLQLQFRCAEGAAGGGTSILWTHQ